MTHAREAAAARRYLSEGERLQPGNLARVDWGRKLPAVKRYPPRAAVRPADPLPALLRDAYGWTRYQWDDWGQATSLPGMANLALGRPLRAVPSGGGLSSSELYPVGEVPGLPSGAYHYDGAAEALDPVRANVTPADLGLDDTPLALLITSVFGRVSFKYGEFGYRLQCLDAGLLAGQILAVLDAAGLGGRLHTRFHDEAAEERLGLTPTAERPLVAVAVRGLPPAAPAAPGAVPLAAPALPTEHTRPPQVLDTMPHTRTLCAASRDGTGPGAPLPPPLVPGPAWPGDAVALPPPDADPLRPDALAVARRERRSLDGRFGVGPITLAQAATVIAAARHTWEGDVGSRHVLLYCLVNDVTGVPRGAYVYDPAGHRLLRTREGDLREEMWLPPPQRWLLGDQRCAMAVYPAGDYAAGFAACGDRWYQMQNIAAGAVAQRVLLAAAGAGLSSRIMCAAAPADVAKLLALPPAHRPLCEILIGPRGHNVAYAQPLSAGDTWPARTPEVTP